MNAPISSPSTAAGSSAAVSAPKSTATPVSLGMAFAPQPQAQTQQASTDLFLKDFTLVAEAAKRAQVAVMVRDFEACGL